MIRYEYLQEVGRLSKRQKQYIADVKEMFDEYNNISQAYTKKIVGMLEGIGSKLEAKIMRVSAEDWISMRLENISRDLDKLLDEFVEEYDKVMLKSLRDSAQSGIDTVIKPAKNNLDFSLIPGEPSIFKPVFMDRYVRQTWNISHTLITEVAQEVGDKIKQKIAFGMAVGDPKHKVISEIVGELGGEKLGFKTLNRRGWAIYRTESNRMNSLARELQMRGAREYLPEAKKIWHHGAYTGISQKARPGHVALDGVAIKFEEMFFNANTMQYIRYPHAPDAVAGEVVNCGCAHTLVMPDDKLLDEQTVISV